MGARARAVDKTGTAIQLVGTGSAPTARGRKGGVEPQGREQTNGGEVRAAVAFSHSVDELSVGDRARGKPTEGKRSVRPKSAGGAGPLKARPETVTAPAAATEQKLRVQIAQGRRELVRLGDRIQRAEAEIESVARQRRLNFEWTESPEERVLKQRLAHLRLRRRAVAKWLSAHRGKESGEGYSDQRPAAAKSKKSKISSGSKKAGKRALRAKSTRSQRAVKGVSSGSGRRRATLIG